MESILQNREEAARLLAEKLSPYAGTHALVLAIPRGAVPMGRTIADALGGELDVVLVRKIGAPGNPEFAVGSVDEAGRVSLNAGMEAYADAGSLEQETATQRDIMARRRSLYAQHVPQKDPRGRTVIIVDDGVATGATMLAAIAAVRARKPSRIIVAIGVAPEDTLETIKKQADDIVCLLTPRHFSAVGQFYRQFPQVEDEEVIKLLRRQDPSGAGED